MNSQQARPHSGDTLHGAGPGEEVLAGGNLNPAVVRVGDTVRRTAGDWTPTVHALLDHLQGVGYRAPVPMGYDDQGREVLTYIPGVVVDPDNYDLLGARPSLEAAGRVIFAYHQAQTTFNRPLDAMWRDNGRDPSGSEEVIAHNDLAPWNLVIGDDSLVFIDWDLAAPGRRHWDLAWALHTLVGLWPDSQVADREVVARMAAFCDGARVAPHERRELLDTVVERSAHNARELRRRASEGDAAYQRMVELGHADRWESGSAHVEANLDRWASLLASAL